MRQPVKEALLDCSTVEEFLFLSAVRNAEKSGEAVPHAFPKRTVPRKRRESV